ncbi:unnamed protein product [Rotaria sordida]|uniref:Uncharacterized protein n=1 Tax=Rotaria sordida TaxID=392033 RepID=A0A815NNN6_9BILA|nr:unnamed protein product [Rotaria sordida]CAF1440461.1 unnamed protein product [Rotaria sordida]
MKHYQFSIINETQKFNLNDCVGIKFHTVDILNTDAKLLPCLIVDKIEKDEKITFKLVCQYGKLENSYSVEHLIDVKLACPEELKPIVLDDLKDITFIRTCKFHVRASTTGRTCDCKRTFMEVQSLLNPAPDLHIIHLKQMVPKEPLLEPPFEGAQLYPKIG